MADCRDLGKEYELAVGNSDRKPPDSWAIKESAKELWSETSIPKLHPLTKSSSRMLDHQDEAQGFVKI